MWPESSPPADPVQSDRLLEQARARLQRPVPPESPLAAVAAAAFFAICALGFAAAAVLAPPTVVSPAAKSGVR